MEHINFSIWIIQTVAMMITALLLPGLTVSGPIGALIAVVGLAFVNVHLWDAALFFAVPTSFSTNAIFLFLANGVIFWVLVKILPGIQIVGFLPALAAPVVFTITGVVLQSYAKDIDWEKAWHRGKAEIQTLRDDFKGSTKQPQRPQM